MNLEILFESVKNLEFGEKMTWPIDEIVPNFSPREWTSAVRYLESEGFVVSGITDKFPTGIYAAEISESGNAIGWKLEDQKIKEIQIRNLERAIYSQKPEAPKTDIKGLKFVPHHVMGVILGDDKGYSEPFLIPSGRIGLFVADTSGIQYGQAAFEGCCAVRDTDEKICGFRLDQNAKRFTQSVKALDLIDIDAEPVQKAITDVIDQNQDYVPAYGTGKLYIRPSVCGAEGGLGIIRPDRNVITFEIAAFGDYLPQSIDIEGRLDIHRPASGADKIAPNYGASFRIKSDVKSRGFADYLSFDDRGAVEEVSTCAIAFIDQKGEYIFPPVRGEDDTHPRHALPSITRKSTIEILRSQGHTVWVRDVFFDEIPDMQGVFTMGNAVGVLRIAKISLRKNLESPANEICFESPEVIKSIDAIRDAVYASRTGNLPGFEKWVTNFSG